MNKRKFTIIIEQADGNYSAYCPEMPGCVAIGATENEAYQNMICPVIRGCPPLFY